MLGPPRRFRAPDRDRYVADLFRSEPFRKHLFALHAFNAEVARVRDIVSDPMLGEIRLQWWRDAIMNGAGGGHPVAMVLNATIAKFKLPKAAFQRLSMPASSDLYDDPMPTLNRSRAATAGDTSSALIQLAAIALAAARIPALRKRRGTPAWPMR